MARMLVLITGGAGFIGSHLADLLLAEGYDVRALDNLEPQVHGGGAPPYLDARVELRQADVRDRDAVRAALDGVEAVFHFAANVGVGQSQYEIARYTSTNVEGTAALLDVLATETHAVRKIVVASSMSIYGEGLYVDADGGFVAPPVRSAARLAAGDFEVFDAQGRRLRPVPTPEWKAAHCESIYALNKRDQEEYTLLFGRVYGVPAVALRFFNTYGSRQSLNNPYTGAAAIFISRIRRGLAPLIYEDGRQQRDFIDVRDVARACLLALRSDEANGRVFNVGSGQPVSIAELASMLCEIAGFGGAPEITGRYRKGDIRHCFADIAAMRAIGFAPRVALRDGLRELYAWSVEQEIAASQAATDAELERHKLLL
jgi:dTDP-L-rhamnose 4-epimerase